MQAFFVRTLLKIVPRTYDIVSLVLEFAPYFANILHTPCEEESAKNLVPQLEVAARVRRYISYLICECYYMLKDCG
jgi:hypothetical protein